MTTQGPIRRRERYGKPAGINPEGEKWYQQTGLGMGQTLNVAAEKKGYTLADRGTYLALKKNLNLDILVEGDAILLNIYHVIEVNPAKWPKVNAAGGKAFADFMVSKETQDIIKTFGIDKFGSPLFFPDAGKKEEELGNDNLPSSWSMWIKVMEFVRITLILHLEEFDFVLEKMDLIFEGIKKAFCLLITFDPEVMGITLLSLEVSGIATLISLLIGISTGVTVALSRFIGKRIVVSLINTGMGLPPVVVGLFVTIFLWRNGPLGFFEILYTPTAMIIAQTVIATPIVMGITLAAIQQLPQKLRLQILALGATRLQMVWILIKEARLPLLAAVMAGFGGVISEVGASIMVGGNIKGYSRVLTTATVMETSRGNFDIAIALGIILLLLAYFINLSPHPDSTERKAEIAHCKSHIENKNIISYE